MSKYNVIRFALGKSDDLNSSVWRVWTHNNDIYVGVRSILGKIKTSLHEDGNCQTSLTKEATKFSEDLYNMRHISKWKAYEIHDGLWRLLDIVIPHDNMKKFHVDNTIAKKIQWVAPISNYKSTQFTFFKSEKYLGENNWIGKKSMGTLLFNMGILNDGMHYYIVYFGHNDLDIDKDIIETMQKSINDYDDSYRAVRIGKSKDTGVGFLIDG